VVHALLLAPAGAHVLVLGAGTGLLPLMSAAAGAGSVTAVERTRMLYRMASQVQLREGRPKYVCSLPLAC
jgi:predicted RNA methylase